MGKIRNSYKILFGNQNGGDHTWEDDFEINCCKKYCKNFPLFHQHRY
jgi:hypothetical protein